MAEINDLDTTDASNTARFPENQAPSSVNNGARALEGLIARWNEDTNGSIVTGNSGNDYTFAAKGTYSAYYDGMVIVFDCNASNTGAATIDVDGIGAKSIKKHNDVALASGDLETGGKYMIVYDGTNFQLLSQVANPPAGAASVITTEGDLIRGSSGGADERFAHGTAGEYVRSDGDKPVWAGISLSDLPSIALDDISNVSVSGPTTGDHVEWTGSSWEDVAQTHTPAAGSVTQSKLSSTQEVESHVGNTVLTDNTFAAVGQFGFWPRIKTSDISIGVRWKGPVSVKSTSYSTRIGLQSDNGVVTVSLEMTYVQACPPYNLGDGEIPLFVWALIDKATGKIVGTSTAPDPPWGNNGPTSIRPQFDDHRTGKKYRFNPINPGFDINADRLDPELATEWARRARMVREIDSHVFENRLLNEDPDPVLADLERQFDGCELVEITPEYKNADMNLFPRPGNGGPGTVEVLLDPVADIMWDLLEWHEAGGDKGVGDLLHDGHLVIGNEGLNRATPPGVRAVGVSWR